MGNDSGELGHNLMDHHFQIGASGKHDGFQTFDTSCNLSNWFVTDSLGSSPIECGEGDVVKIMETKPISKNKCWRLVQIIEKAK